MSWLVGSSLRFARLVAAVAVGVLAVGVVQLSRASVDLYPEFRQTTVEVQAEALGLSAVEVEQLITVPLEQDLLNGVPWVERITSKSVAGLSSVELVFEDGTDLYQARQVVQERMTQAHALPGVGTPPVVVQPQSSVNRVAMIALSSSSVSPVEMSVLARWQVRPRLLGVPGVANVSIWGQRDRQLQVQVDPEQLAANDVTLTRLIETTGNALWVSSLSFVEASTPGTGGFVETPNQRVGVQHVSPITSADQLADVVISRDDKSQRIGEVARVVEDHQPLIGDAALDGEPTILIVIDKFPEASPTQVGEDLDEAMLSMAAGLPGIDVDTTVYRPDGYIDSALRNLGIVGAIGLLLAIAVIALLFASLRVALMSLVVVPLPAAAGLLVLHLGGVTFTSMTVVGLAAAVTVFVDDVVADVDTLHLVSTAAPDADTPQSTVRVATAVLSNRTPLAVATGVTVFAVAPLLFATGVVGDFTRPAAVTYLAAVLASLVVALTVTPALSLLLLKRLDGSRQPAAHRWFVAAYDRARLGSLSKRGAGLVAAAAVALGVVALVPQLSSGSVLPTVQDRNIRVVLETAPGTSLTEMNRVTGLLAREIGSLETVSQVGTQVGRALTSEQVVDVNSAELWVRITPDADQKQTTAAVTAITSGYPGVSAQVGSYPDERLAAANAPPAADLVVRVYGDDFATMQQTAEQVRGAIASVRGVVDPQVEVQSAQPVVHVEVDLDRASAWGIKPGDVRREAATLVSGLPVGSLYEEQKVFDVVVWGGPAVRHSPEGLASLPITAPGGRLVPLGEIADVAIAPVPTVVQHDAVRRYVDVLASVPGRDISDVEDEVTSRLRGLALPLEYRTEVVPATGAGGPSGSWWLAAGLAVAVGIFLLYQAATNSWRAAGLLFLVIPVAGVGALVVAPVVGGIQTAGALAGLLGVLVLAMRQSLVLLERVQNDRGVADGEDLRAVVSQAVRGRVTAVLVTSLAVAAALLPAAFATGDGLEILHPAAVVVLGGLVTSVLVTLVVVPALYPAFMTSGSGPGGQHDIAEDGSPTPPVPAQEGS
ncbi:MAG: efflux RND transporter permease subunit [Actinomycetota bacterium]|nr:efflux RND transporter permease subunit [Actinomycetota bacterium]